MTWQYARGYPICLYLVRNDIEKTALMTCDGTNRFGVTTREALLFGSPETTVIIRPGDTDEESIVAEIQWPSWEPDLVRSTAFDGGGKQWLEVRNVLEKLGWPFSSSRYFRDKNNEEYKWRDLKRKGLSLIRCRTAKEIVRFQFASSNGGKWNPRWHLEFDPSVLEYLDLELMVTTFVIMERRRRNREGEYAAHGHHDHEPCEGGLGEVGC